MTKKEIAILLRKEGKTYGEIIKILKVPKSTVCSWLKNIELPLALKQEILKRTKEKCRNNILAFNKIYGPIRSKNAAKIREEITKNAAKEINALSNNELKLIGSALYWAEGNVKNRNRLQLGNSNHLIIKITIQFFREICNVPDNKITARVHIYPGINYQKALNFWSKITKLPKTNFKQPQIQISKASKGKRPRNTLPYGTLHLTVNNTELACKVKGWIQGISEKI